MATKTFIYKNIGKGVLNSVDPDNLVEISGSVNDIDTLVMPITPFGENATTGDKQPFIATTFAFRILEAQAFAYDVPTGGSGITIQVKKNGNLITSTGINIPSGANNSTGGTPAIFTDNEFEIGDILTPNISDVGSTEAGKNVNIVLTIQKI